MRRLLSRLEATARRAFRLVRFSPDVSSVNWNKLLQTLSHGSSNHTRPPLRHPQALETARALVRRGQARTGRLKSNGNQA